jgi:hypothetical protein
MPRKFVIAALFPKKHPPFIAYAQAVVAAWTGNSVVPNPPVTVAAVGTLVTALVTAQAVAVKKGAGSAAIRNTARDKVEVAFRQWETYAEGILGAMAPEDATAALATLGFHQKKPGTHAKQEYAITWGEASGSADIDLKAVGRHGTVQYCHQYMLPGTTIWVDWPPSLDTKVTITGLPVGGVVSFRWRTLIKGVYGNWSQTLTLLIH